MLGIILHFVADAQKYYTQRVQKGLFEDGLFCLTRNPNYLGEILIFIAFGILYLALDSVCWFGGADLRLLLAQ